MLITGKFISKWIYGAYTGTVSVWTLAQIGLQDCNMGFCDYICINGRTLYAYADVTAFLPWIQQRLKTFLFRKSFPHILL